MLSAKGLSHTYGSGPSAHLAIKELSFDVADGEFVSIVGPSGAGKTTLIRILAGLQRPTSGTVEIDGEVIRDVPAGMALVFQDYSRSLLPWLTVEKNVAFPLRGRRGDHRDLVRSSLAAVGLENAGKRYPGQLSGGMQQRVAIARALAYRPRLLLMDEPFASVDAQTRGDLEDLILRLKSEFDMTVVFITHDIDESVYVADRVLVLSPAPTELVDDLVVRLPEPRDQIRTKEAAAFVETRAKVASLILQKDRPRQSVSALERSA